jgi:hypothetical protein
LHRHVTYPTARKTSESQEKNQDRVSNRVALALSPWTSEPHQIRTHKEQPPNPSQKNSPNPILPPPLYLAERISVPRFLLSPAPFPSAVSGAARGEGDGFPASPIRRPP